VLVDLVTQCLTWVHDSLAKEPSVTLPSAVATLRSRAGDCNEHAQLFVALARAVGIPARTISGVVAIDGKFYYHAWAEVMLQRWVGSTRRRAVPSTRRTSACSPVDSPRKPSCPRDRPLDLTVLSQPSPRCATPDDQLTGLTKKRPSPPWMRSISSCRRGSCSASSVQTARGRRRRFA
jgi:hypothetical protein